MIDRTQSSAPYWSLEGLVLGARLMLPLVPGMIAFAIAVGSTAAGKGLSFIESMLMNVLVYAGASQMVALGVWPEQLTVASIAALALLAGTVNARMLLLGAGLRPWLGPLPAWQTYPTLHLLTDPGWIVAMRYRGEGGSDVSVLLGGALLVFAVWMAATTAGYLLGALVPNPRAFALDLVMPIFFAAMLVPLWRGRRRAIPWVVAGVVALAVSYLVEGWWYVIAGSLAGTIAGGFVHDE
ncbi:MAG: AzlC family ABC transporter permease [Bradyrhizobiaceae bacterium]|nr:AzlC family ABC transporter permease [Bradyrhizobiaceae bacterium]